MYDLLDRCPSTAQPQLIMRSPLIVSMLAMTTAPFLQFSDDVYRFLGFHGAEADEANTMIVTLVAFHEKPNFRDR